MCLGRALKPREKKLKNSRSKTTFHIHETNIMINGHLIIRHCRGQKSVERHTHDTKRKMVPDGKHGNVRRNEEKKE